MTIAALFLIPALAGLCAAAHPDGEEGGHGDALVTRLYQLPLPQRAIIGMDHVPSFALLCMFNSNVGDDEPEGVLPESEQILDLVRSNIAPEEWEYEGRRLQLSSSRLLVTAPEPIQREVRAFLDYLEARLTSTTELTFSIYSVRGDHKVPAAAAGLHPSDAAERMVREMMADDILGPARTLRARCLPLQAAIAGGRRQVSFVADWDVEIAQGAAIADPIIDTVSIGSDVRVRATPMRGGTAVQMVLRLSDLLEPLQSYEVGAFRELNGDAKPVDSRFLSYVIQEPRVASSVLATTTFLPAGQDLVLILDASGPWGPFQHLVHLHINSAAGQVPLITKTTAGTFSLFDIALLASPGIDASGELRPSSLASMSEDSANTLWFAISQESNADEILERLQNNFPEPGDEDRVDQLGRALVASGEESFVRAAVETIEQTSDTLAAPHLLDLTLTDRERSTTYLRATMALSEAAAGWVAVGSEAWYHSDYDVEVAQNSAITDPVTSSLAHALLAKASIRAAGAEGRFRIDLGAALQLVPQNPQPFKIPAWMEGKIELAQENSAFVQQSLELAPGAEAIIGDLSPSTAKGLLMVVHLR